MIWRKNNYIRKKQLLIVHFRPSWPSIHFDWLSLHGQWMRRILGQCEQQAILAPGHFPKSLTDSVFHLARALSWIVSISRYMTPFILFFSVIIAPEIPVLDDIYSYWFLLISSSGHSSAPFTARLAPHQQSSSLAEWESTIESNWLKRGELMNALIKIFRTFERIPGTT